jgi:hypothetical protein
MPFDNNEIPATSRNTNLLRTARNNGSVDNLPADIVISPYPGRKALRGGDSLRNRRGIIPQSKSPAWVNHYVSRIVAKNLNPSRRESAGMTTLGQKLIPYSLPRLISGLSLLAALVAGSVMLVDGHAARPAATEPVVQLTGASPEDLLADALGSQVSSLVNAVSAYQTVFRAHGDVRIAPG